VPGTISHIPITPISAPPYDTTAFSFATPQYSTYLFYVLLYVRKTKPVGSCWLSCVSSCPVLFLSYLSCPVCVVVLSCLCSIILSRRVRSTYCLCCVPVLSCPVYVVVYVVVVVLVCYVECGRLMFCSDGLGSVLWCPAVVSCIT
jgi:hypothetical protein